MKGERELTAIRYLQAAAEAIERYGDRSVEAILAARVYGLLAYREDDLDTVITDIKKEHQEPI